MAREKEVEGLWEVTHECFITDHIGFATRLVLASNQSMALKTFNGMAEIRKEYPYKWKKAKLNDIRPAKAIC